MDSALARACERLGERIAADDHGELNMAGRNATRARRFLTV
jgi:hypothetical protein